MEGLVGQIDRQRIKRYKNARDVAKHLASILVEKYNVKKIILIGSCSTEDAFHFHSDIDLCVEGLYGSLYFQALGELTIEAGEFDVDLIPVEDATERMKKYIKKGEILYER